MFDGLLPSRYALIVFVGGVVSMGLEILAGRVLAPVFGSTIYTWGSIIGVSLLALTLGYHHGGRMSSAASQRAVDVVLLGSSAYIVLLSLVQDVVLAVFGALPVPSRFAALLPVAVLFGPPTYVLGYVSPFVAELVEDDNTGEVAGWVYAVGTAGSLLGAFGTTFVMIPFLSVTTIYGVFAVLLVVPFGYRIRSSWPWITLVLIGLIGSQWVAVIPGDAVFASSTPYQDIRVADDNGVRTMYLDGQPQSAMYLDNRSGYVFDYTKYFHIPFLLGDVESALFIGGGGFSGPKRFAMLNVSVDAVEIDPGVISAAKTYFNVSSSAHLRIHEGDGRRFVASSDSTYDVIILDAYRKTSVPFHLTTTEFMELLHGRLDTDGVVVSNVISTASGPGSELARAQYKTMQSVFESVYYMPTKNTSLAQNVIIVASKDEQVSRRTLVRRAADYEAVRMEPSVLRYADPPSVTDVPVLSDSYAPVETLLSPLLGRRYVTDG